MPSHPAIDTLINRIENDLIGGAADMAKETAAALGTAIRDSRAPNEESLRIECLGYFDRIIEVTPSVMPVTYVLHRVGSELERGDSRRSVEELRRELIGATDSAARWIGEAVHKIASYGADLIADGEVLFTYSIWGNIDGRRY